MNFQKEAIQDLSTYPQRLKARDNLKERIYILNERYTSLKGVSTSEPVKGGISKQEEKMLDNIAERERLGFSLKIVDELIKLTERGLAGLDSKERRVLDGFYINPIDNHVVRLCDELNIEKSSLYRLKDTALKKFTRSEYGIIEL